MQKRRANSLFRKFAIAAGTLVAGVAVATTSAVAEWQPTKAVELIVPAGTGGGADQMARVVQGIIQKNNLMNQPMVVINRAGGAGAEGFLDVKSSTRNPHKLIITLSNLFTTPLATGVPFNWKELTPVAMLALDEFILWTNANAPYKSAKELIDAAKASTTAEFKMGGTGSKQEDQIITAAIEQATGAKFIYVPYKGGGDVAAQLVGGHITASVNNPIEAVSQWRAGNLRPLCVFDNQRMPYQEEIVNGQSWNSVATCKESGLDIEYLMLRGIFMPANATADQVTYYVDLFKRVRETPDWKDYMEKGAYNTTFLSGKEFEDWLTKAEARHKELMQNAGFLAASAK